MEAGNKTVLCPGCGALNTDHAGFCSACGEEITREAVRILPVGTNLDQGRYTVTGFVGRGGSAITYRARQRNFSQEIVLREYYPSVIAKRAQDNRNVIPTALQIENDFERGKIQFRKEGDSLRSMRDIPNIVTVYDVFEDNNTVYMVEDYIKGESLQTFLNREGKLSFRQAMKILTPVMKALAAVHSHEILHRDVKPSNIMLENGAPCLIDFGISRKIREMTTLSSEPGPRTRTIASSYTKGYAALEQITGEERETAAVDVYGAAATLYRMVTGVSPDDALSRQRQDYLLPPIEAGAHISKRQSDIIMQGLSLYAKDRFQTMQVFLNLLEESLEEPKQEEAVKGKKDPPKRTFPWVILLNALLVFCIVLLFVTRILPLLRGGNAADPAASAPAEENGEMENAMLEEETSSPEESTEENAEESEGELVQTEQPRRFSFYVRILDCRNEALSDCSVCLSRLLIDSMGNTQKEVIWAGQTDGDGWTGALEAEETDDEILVELPSYGFSQTVTLEEIEAFGGEISFPFHLYPVTYSFGGHTYALGDLSDAPDLNSYDAVESYCESIGGHLAVINSREEDKFLYDISCQKGRTTAFFGYSDQDQEGIWEWAYGSSSYTNWTPDGAVHPAPDNGGPGWGPENYAEYNEGDDAANDGTWNDAKFAVNTSTFIIEWEF